MSLNYRDKRERETETKRREVENLIELQLFGATVDRGAGLKGRWREERGERG